ncbi:SDR family oxidoreductase [Streptomyces sp. NPDC001858]
MDERTLADAETAGTLGYAETKVTAERELRAAAVRGVPVTVFRPGVVTRPGSPCPSTRSTWWHAPWSSSAWTKARKERRST